MSYSSLIQWTWTSKLYISDTLWWAVKRLRNLWVASIRPFIKAKWNVYDKSSEQSTHRIESWLGIQIWSTVIIVVIRGLMGSNLVLSSAPPSSTISSSVKWNVAVLIRIHLLKIALPFPIWSSWCQGAACWVLWLKSYKGSGRSFLPMLYLDQDELITQSWPLIWLYTLLS